MSQVQSGVVQQQEPVDRISNVICIRDMLQDDELSILEDDDEYEELENGVLELCGGFGQVSSIRIPRTISSASA